MVYKPYFFCLDTAGNILITDGRRHDVKILSPSGHLIHKIGKEGHGRGEFSLSTWYLCVGIRNYICCILE